MNKITDHVGLIKWIKYSTLVVGTVSLLMLLLPFVSYTYKKVMYTISGLEYLLGKTVMSGKVSITPSIWMMLLVIVCIAVMVVGLLYSRLSLRIVGTVLLVLGAFHIILNIIATKRIENYLEKAKDVGPYMGSIFMMVMGLAIMVIGMLVLKKAKILSTLDFMVLPGIIYIVINNYLPMAGILIAFKKIDYNVGILKSPWVGLENFKYLFATNDAFIITRNTLGYNILFIIFGNIMGILVAIALSEIFSKRLQKFFQTSILLPHMISMVIVAYIVFGFLGNQSGWINNSILGKTGGVNFYQEKVFWPFILTFVNTWKILGYSSIIYLSSVVGIDRSLYEAAYVDGCGRFRQITKITLPLLKPTVITMLMIQVGRIFYSDFGLFYQVPMNSGILFSVTQTIDTYVYRSLLQSNNIAMASAAGAYQSVVGFCLVLFVNWIIRKADKENALF